MEFTTRRESSELSQNNIAYATRTNKVKSVNSTDLSEMITKPSSLGRDNRSYSDNDVKKQQENDRKSETDQQPTSTDRPKSQLTSTSTTTSDSHNLPVSSISNSKIMFVHNDDDSI